MAVFPLLALVMSLLLVLPGSGDAGKILLLPVAVGSHYMNFDQIARALLARGHDVHAYMNYNCENRKAMAALGVTIHSYKHTCFGDDESEMRKFVDMLIKVPSFFELVSTFRSMGEQFEDEIETFFGSQSVINELKAVHFDLCILDGMFQTVFFHIIPYKLDIPAVSLLALFQPFSAGVPGIPSFTPFINFGKYTNEMTFTERVHNILMTTIMNAIMNNMNPGASENLVAKYAPEKPYISMTGLQKRARMWLVMNDVVIDYPQVRMPHVVDVGGLNTRPGRPLPEDLQKIADEAHKGLIIVSFGTYITGFPTAITKKFFKALGHFKQTVVMRFTEEPEDLPDNVHLRAWIPQNDLLAHPNTVLFITHCGVNGQFEALYNGVPMLGFPIFGDQFYNALRMAKKGLGLHLELQGSTSEEIVTAINEILTNESFSKAMALHSAMFNDRLQTPIEKLVYSLEQMIKYGPDHLYNPAVNLPWYIYWCLDVATLFSLIAVVVMSLLFVLFRCIFRCACNSKKQKMKKQ